MTPAPPQPTPAAWHRTADEIPPPGVAVVVRTGGRFYEAVWTGKFWKSREWPGFATRGVVAEWAAVPEEGR